MEIAERDLKIILLKEAIRANKDFIINKMVRLEKAQHENVLLKTIYQDYKKYYTYIMQEKIKQKAQMDFLTDYLEKSIITAGLSDSEVQKARHEQKNILNELASVRADLEMIIENK